MSITVIKKDGTEFTASVWRVGTLKNGDLSYSTTDGQLVHVKAAEWQSVTYVVTF